MAPCHCVRARRAEPALAYDSFRNEETPRCSLAHHPGQRLSSRAGCCCGRRCGRLGVDVEILYADGDSIQQSQQILKFVQAERESRPDGIILEPVGGTGLPQVARAAVVDGIGWAVMNRELEYVHELRQSYKCSCSGFPQTTWKLAGFRENNWLHCFPKVERSCTFKARRKPTPPSCARKGYRKPSRRKFKSRR